MSKKKIDDVVLKNLSGFVRKGAAASSPGNVPTGHFELDFAIHYGESANSVDFSSLSDYDPKKTLGLPLGRVVELFGEEGGGKSSLAYRVCGYAQKMGYKCLWIDTEHSFAENLARLNGCDPDSLYYTDMANREDLDKVYHGEDVLDGMVSACKSGIQVIVLDSVANLIPQARMDADASQQLPAIRARMWSEMLPKIVQYADHYGALVILINQLREKVGQYGNPIDTPGGRSIKHNASIRIRISKKSGKDADIEIVEDNGHKKIIGRYANVRLVKNKMSKPLFDTLRIPIYYEKYFPSVEEMMFDAGRQMKLITVMKGVYKWGEHRIEGRENFVQYIRDNNLSADLLKELKEVAQEKDVLLPPEIVQTTLEDLNNKNKVVKEKDEEESVENHEIDVHATFNDDVSLDFDEQENNTDEKDKVSGKTRRGRKKKTSKNS